MNADATVAEIDPYELNPRRLAVLVVSPDVFVSICQNNDRPFKMKITRNALPADARCVHVIWNSTSKTMGLVIWSQSFADTPPDVELPQLPPVEVAALYEVKS